MKTILKNGVNYWKVENKDLKFPFNLSLHYSNKNDKIKGTLNSFLDGRSAGGKDIPWEPKSR